MNTKIRVNNDPSDEINFRKATTTFGVNISQTKEKKIKNRKYNLKAFTT